MQTQVSIHHDDYPATVREIVDHELDALSHRVRGIIAVRARLERTQTAHRVELVASVAHSPTVVANVTDGSFRRALGQATARMERSIRRPRERRASLRRGGNARIGT